MSLNKKTFCIQPFKEIAIKSWTGTRLNEAWPCCVMGNYSYKNEGLGFRPILEIENVESLTPQEIFDHPRMQLLRENLLNGVRDSACQVCWDMEDKNIKSHRQFFTEDEGFERDDIEPNLTDIDLTTSNACNLRCRMCRPSASNSLYIDLKYFKENNKIDEVMQATENFFIKNEEPIISTESKQFQWIYNNTDKITKIKASGGEPFYDKKIIKLLEKYIKDGTAKNTELSFHTNGTQFDDRNIKILKQFKLNSHTISIDGAHKIYEYIRYPFKFDELETSLNNYVTKIDCHPLKINLVVNAYNLLTIKDFLKWATSVTENECNIVFSETYPLNRGISLKHLPMDILLKSRREITDLRCQKINEKHNIHFEKLISMVEDALIENTENRELMKKEITLFDQSRDQSYREYLDSAIVEWLDKC